MARPTLVLLVPGDSLTGLLTESGLTSYGYEVILAQRPDEALDHLRSNRRIKVLVVDADLPNGFGLARFARQPIPRSTSSTRFGRRARSAKASWCRARPV